MSPEPSLGLTAFRVALPLREPHVAAHGVETVRDVILVRARRPDGIDGWGECPTLSGPGYSAETTEVAWRSLTAGTARGPMASGAVADAQLDASLRARGESLASFLGATRATVPMTRVVSLGREPDAGLVATCVAVKFKVDPATIGRLRGVRDRHPGLVVMADANGSFGTADEVPAWIDELGLALLEQPLAAGDLAGHAALRGRLATPIALDESIGSPSALRMAIEAGALDVVSVKPARVGGVSAARACLDLAARAGLGAFVGGMLETGIGRAGAVALAATPGCTLPTDLGPSARYFDRDLCAPILVDADGGLAVPGGPGIGRVPDMELLAAWCTAEAPVRRE